ncbi:hypothetical protein DPM33_35300 [Mesorhizobium hawassense]|uniref:Uncharacterized protein n=1 Tax=Mesorhizobium hawassense TaxID=1209954 RepID=A0A330H5X4_9HYPH|nr:hypothetical protein DPM33_35300 [Mesorhizobium hawassense]
MNDVIAAFLVVIGFAESETLPATSRMGHFPPIGTMQRDPVTALVHFGGLVSTTCLAWALDFERVETIGLDSGSSIGPSLMCGLACSGAFEQTLRPGVGGEGRTR